MKISKKDLRKIILESMIKEQEAGGSEEVSQDIFDKISDMGADALKQVGAAVDSAMGNESDKSGDAAASGEESEEASAGKSGSKKIKRNEKTERIQAMLQMAGAYSTKSGNDDGQWGKGTTDAWKKWLTLPVTLEKFAALVKQKNAESTVKEESRELFDLFSKIISEADDAVAAALKDYGIPDDLDKLFKKGAAAPIAAYFGLKPNLTGVDQLVKKLEDVEVPEEEEKEADPEVDEEADENIDLEDLKQLNTKIQELSIPANAEYFKMKGSAFTSKNPRRTIDININNPNTWKEQTRYITDNGELKIFKEGDLDSDKNAGKIMKKMFFNESTGEIIIGKGGRDIKIFPVKLENSFVVPRTPDTTVQESLSRGSLIRKRYWGRY